MLGLSDDLAEIEVSDAEENAEGGVPGDAGDAGPPCPAPERAEPRAGGGPGGDAVQQDPAERIEQQRG